MTQVAKTTFNSNTIKFISVNFRTDSNTVFEEIITYDTQIDDYQQMNMMDDILVLPQRAVTVSATETHSVDGNRGTVESNKSETQFDDTITMIELDNTSDNQTVEISPREESETVAKNVPVVQTLNRIFNEMVFAQEVKTSGQMVKTLPSSDMIVMSDKSVTDRETEVVNKSTRNAVSVPKIHVEQDKEKKVVTPPIITISPAVFNQATRTKPCLQKAVVVNTQKIQNRKSEQILPLGSGKGKLKIISSSTLNQEDTKRRIMDAVNKMSIPTSSVVIHTPPTQVGGAQEITKQSEEISPNETITSSLQQEQLVETELVNTEKLDVEKTVEKPTDEKQQAHKPHVNIVRLKVPLKEVRPSVSSVIPFESMDNVADTSTSESIQSDDNVKILPSEIGNVLTAGSVVNSHFATPLEMNKETSIDIPDQSKEALEIKDSEETVKDVTIIQTNNEIETTEPNGTVCDISKDDVDKESSPQVAIEYVVFGDRIIPIHKPFSQSKAGVYKKKTTSRKYCALC